jgi:hypothetical protein
VAIRKTSARTATIATATRNQRMPTANTAHPLRSTSYQRA